MNVPPISLRFAEQLSLISNVLSDELQQLVSSLQVGFTRVVTEINSIQGAWVDVDFAASNYTTNSLGAITALPANRPYVYRYKRFGKTMLFNATVKVAVTNAFTSEIRVKIPGAAVPAGFGGLTGDNENMQRTACVFNDSGGTQGVAMASINVGGRYVAVQRWDSPSSFTSGADTYLGFMVQIPLA